MLGLEGTLDNLNPIFIPSLHLSNRKAISLPVTYMSHSYPSPYFAFTQLKDNSKRNGKVTKRTIQKEPMTRKDIYEYRNSVATVLSFNLSST
jgi:hypothetical protein